MVNKCSTCKYFGSPRVHNGDELSDAYNIRTPDYKWCGLLQIGEWGAPENRPPAYVIDASGFYACLCVKEDFGCNQWEARDCGHGQIVQNVCPVCEARIGHELSEE